jgi:hypothetical protein
MAEIDLEPIQGVIGDLANELSCLITSKLVNESLQDTNTHTLLTTCSSALFLANLGGYSVQLGDRE